MKVLRERDGQMLLKYEESAIESFMSDVKFEWWYDVKKMEAGIRLEEKNDKTHIYCYVFYGRDKENWLMDEFDRRVPRYRIM